MNSYDKNFLFRMSYALTRRFALVEVDVPSPDDQTRWTQSGTRYGPTRVPGWRGVESQSMRPP